MPTATATPAALRRRDEVAQIVDAARFVRRLHERAERPVGRTRRLEIADDQLDAERFGPRRRTSIVCGKQRVGDEELRRARAAGPIRVGLHPVQHRHRFGGGSRLVEQRRVGDLHARQVAHHRLKREQRLEASLRDLGLVGVYGVYQPGFSRTLRTITLGVMQS